MNVHQFGILLKENKHLYSEDEYYQLLNEWRKDYEQYLVNKVKY